MEIWLAYAFDVPQPSERVTRALARVERHYQAVTSVALARQGWTDERLGAVTWDEANPDRRWPSWTAEGGVAVASFHVPLSYRTLTPSLPPAAAPVAFARALLASPGRLSELAPPFALAAHDRDDQSLTVLTDGLGFARIFEQRFADGWAWSNCLGALPIFVGAPPQADLRGWRFMAASGWFMSDSTSLANVRVLAPGSIVRMSARHAVTTRSDQRVDAPRRWAEPRKPLPEAIADAAQSLVQVAKTVQDVWSQAPVVQLSGGRDSRMVAAGVVAADIDVSFTTIASLSGELVVAQQLLAALPKRYAHDVETPRDVSVTGTLPERAAALHMLHDGMIGHGGLRGGLARTVSPGRPSFGGAGGEVVRGSFYRTTLERIEKDPSWVVRRLTGLYRVHGGVVETAHSLVDDHVARVLDDGRSIGLAGPGLLDWFYLVERLRRWANTPIRPGSIAPLVSPAVLRAGFDLEPRARVEDVLPAQVAELLVPPWRSVAYYKATRDDFRAMTRKRYWETEDASYIAHVVRTADVWAEVFDQEAVEELWAEALAGGGLNKHESVLERLAFRASFDDHLKRLSAAATWEEPAASLR